MTIRYSFFLALSGASLLASDGPWSGKPASQWSPEDAKQVLTDSPWAKSVEPGVDRTANGGRGSRAVLGRGGIGIGVGGRGGGVGRVPPPRTGGTPASVIVRWESALPVQEAQLKTNADAPAVSEDSYTIAVVGLPNRLAGSDPDALAAQLKHQAELGREGRKSIRSSEARVLPRDEGLIILFSFPRSEEIVPADRSIEFKARIGGFEIDSSFDLPGMTYAGKLQL